MRADAKKCRVHKTELMTDLNGVPFCRHCRNDREAVRQQISRGPAVDLIDDPEERRAQLAEQLGATA